LRGLLRQLTACVKGEASVNIDAVAKGALMTLLLLNTLRALGRLRRDGSGQDLIEYALLAGFVAVAAAALFPQEIAPAIRTIFTKVGTNLTAAATQGS
jgi:Flp pilus assembly pilin Flp